MARDKKVENGNKGKGKMPRDESTSKDHYG